VRGLAAAILLVARVAAADTKAGDLFADAEKADKRGDLSGAISAYKRSFELAEHPNTAYNLADAYERNGNYSDAILYYELYLALSPRAADKAKVRKKITGLEVRPTTYEIESDDLKKAYVIVDGAIVKKPGGNRVDVKLVPGFHTIDVVTPEGYASEEVEVRRSGGSKPYQPGIESRPDSTAIISVAVLTAFQGREKIESAKPLALPAGRHAIAVYDNWRECSPVIVDVKGSGTVHYVHIAPAEVDNSPRGQIRSGERCRKLAVTQHVLTFKP
jgi:tetratricopeptide (TPR) repeat protein